MYHLNFGLGFYNVSTFLRYVCVQQRHMRVSAYEDIACMSIAQKSFDINWS